MKQLKIEIIEIRSNWFEGRIKLKVKTIEAGSKFKVEKIEGMKTWKWK